MSYALRARPAPVRTSSATKSRRSNSETPSSPASAQSTPEDDWKDEAPRSSPERKRKESAAKGEDKPPVEKRPRMEMTIQQTAATSGTPHIPDFVPFPTPTLDQICFNLSDTLRGMRSEGTTDNNLQHSSQAHIDLSILHLPTHAHRSALCLTLNRYSAFCAATAVDIPAFPITATKVTIFLARSAKTQTGRRLFQLLPQPMTFELPIYAREEALSRGEEQGESALGLDEGLTVTMELVRSWTEALAYAEGSTKAIWGPILQLGGEGLLQHPLIGELLGSFESEAAINHRRRRAGIVSERGSAIRDAAVSTRMVRSGGEMTPADLMPRQGVQPMTEQGHDWRSAQQQVRSNQPSFASHAPIHSAQTQQSINQQESFARPQGTHQSTSIDSQHPLSASTVQQSPFSRPQESALTSRARSSGLPYATPRTLHDYDLGVRNLPPISLSTTFQRTTSDPQGFILGEGHGIESNEGTRTQSRNQGGGGRVDPGGDGEKLSQLALVASLGENANVEQAQLEPTAMFSIDHQHAQEGSRAYQEAEATFNDPQAGWSSTFDSSNQLDTSSQSFYASSIPSTTEQQSYGTHPRQPLSIVPPTNYGNPDQLSTHSPRISKGGLVRAVESPRSTISPGMPMANDEYFLSQLSGVGYDQRGQPQYMHPPARRDSMMGSNDGRGGGRNQYGESNFQESQFDNHPRSSHLSHSTNYPPPASPALRPSTGTTAYPATPASTEFGYSENPSSSRFGPPAAPSSHYSQQQQQHSSSNQQASQQFHQQTSYSSPMVSPAQSYYQQPPPSSDRAHEGGMGDSSAGYGGGGGGGFGGGMGGGGFHSGQRSFSLPVSSTGRSYPSQQSTFSIDHPQQQQQRPQKRYPSTQLDYQLSPHVELDPPLLPAHPLDVDSSSKTQTPSISTTALETASGEKLALAQKMSEEAGLSGLGIDSGTGGEGKSGNMESEIGSIRAGFEGGKAM